MIPLTNKTIVFRSIIARVTLACLAVALVTVISSQVSFAQSQTKTSSEKSSEKKDRKDGTSNRKGDGKSNRNFDQSKFQSFLETKDANGNGSLEPDERSNNIKAYLSRLGMNTEKSIKIEKAIAKAAKKAGKNSDDTAAKAEKKVTNLKVPGFGVAEADTTVKGFGTSDASVAKNNAKNYSQNVVERTKKTLEIYDRNGDGALDQSEMVRARWGSPDPSTNDLNGDGRLSTFELHERYAARERSRNDSSKSQNNGSRNQERAKISEAISSSKSSTLKSRSSSSAAVATKIKESESTKYQRYAQSLIKTYDRNSDGKLSPAEMEKMRRPPVNADTNDDGYVSTTELINSLSSSSKNKSARASSTTAKSKAASSKSYAQKKDYKSRSSSGRRSRDTSSLGGGLDVNGDNQIQMHEFADQWDDEVLAEYYEKDKNKDGLITEDEWSHNK